ncbi:MAG: hypothetical protein K0V04_02495 [Deltaproteobacteria bacterium]|nr:hypothetical protein [Deltaproteobacteria bacterium]
MSTGRPRARRGNGLAAFAFGVGAAISGCGQVSDVSDLAVEGNSSTDVVLTPEDTSTTVDSPEMISGSSSSEDGTSGPGDNRRGTGGSDDGSSGSKPGGGTGACCQPQPTPGCEDPFVTSCVCAVDDYCCEAEWDALCVDLSEDLECQACGESGPRPTGDCCLAEGEAGCLDEPVATCVCDSDPFCCVVAWDEVCVEQVDALGCGTCAQNAVAGSCCAPNGTPGCEDPGIELCVCDLDPFCCSVEWDELCVDVSIDAGCDSCIPGTEPGGTSGGGGTAGDSGTAIDPPGGSGSDTGWASGTDTGWASGTTGPASGTTW